MSVDQAIEMTRRARGDISAALGHDPVKVIAYYVGMQGRFGDRLRRRPSDQESAQDEAAVDASVPMGGGVETRTGTGK